MALGPGRVLSSRGHVLVRVPEDHRLRRRDGYVLESHLVMERKLRRRLEKNERVYHLDGDRLNNAPENLALVREREIVPCRIPECTQPSIARRCCRRHYDLRRRRA